MVLMKRHEMGVKWPEMMWNGVKRCEILCGGMISGGTSELLNNTRRGCHHPDGRHLGCDADRRDSRRHSMVLRQVHAGVVNPLLLSVFLLVLFFLSSFLFFFRSLVLPFFILSLLELSLFFLSSLFICASSFDLLFLFSFFFMSVLKLARCQVYYCCS